MSHLDPQADTPPEVLMKRLWPSLVQVPQGCSTTGIFHSVPNLGSVAQLCDHAVIHLENKLRLMDPKRTGLSLRDRRRLRIGSMLYLVNMFQTCSTRRRQRGRPRTRWRKLSLSCDPNLDKQISQWMDPGWWECWSNRTASWQLIKKSNSRHNCYFCHI